MNTKTRLAVMLGLLLLGFAATALLLRSLHLRETGLMLSNLQRERRDLLERVIILNGQTLRNFATDYSNWDEMLAFSQSGDRAWAAINLDASLQTFNTQVAWVLRPDGSLVYGATRQVGDALRTPPGPPAALLARLHQDHFARFFVATADGLLEVRAGPIQPSSDVARTTPPRGWLLVGQLWSPAYLKNIATVLDSDLTLLPADSRVEFQPDDLGIHFQEPLAGVDGRPIGQLHAYYHPEALVRLLEDNKDDLYVFYSFGLVVIALTFGGVSRWVINPLRRLEQSMATGSPAPLADLREKSDEFGRLARMTEASFNQRAALSREVEEHRQTETALRQSEAEARRSSELRIRLARDLHDGVIQSIYAAGLGLESARAAVGTDPATATQRLAAVRGSLNQTIREVRSFINTLEPEGPAGFAQALQTLATTMEALHLLRIDLQVSPGAAAGLRPGEQLHVLQIVRESISNAVRHGDASVISLRLHEEAGATVLTLEDNGRGFEPAVVTAGSGLVNLTARAREIGASLHLESEPGNGTRLTLRLNPNS